MTHATHGNTHSLLLEYTAVMLSIEELYNTLKGHTPSLTEAITFEQAAAFVSLATKLKDFILLGQIPSHDPTIALSHLPENVKLFLGAATEIPDEYVSGCREAFVNKMWSSNGGFPFIRQSEKLLHQYGLEHCLCKS